MAPLRYAAPRRRDRRAQPSFLELDRAGAAHPRSRLCRGSSPATPQALADAPRDGARRRSAAPRPRRAVVAVLSRLRAEPVVQRAVEQHPPAYLLLQAGIRSFLSLVAMCPIMSSNLAFEWPPSNSCSAACFVKCIHIVAHTLRSPSGFEISHNI